MKVAYPSTRLNTWLGVYHGNKLIASGATMQTLIDQKNVACDLLVSANNRVRHHYIAGGDEGEYTVELAHIGEQPMRLPGEAQPQPFPEHASSIVAYRKPLGGVEEKCSVSVGSIVGVSDFSPMVVGMTYALSWAGKNSLGFGKRSAPFNFIA